MLGIREGKKQMATSVDNTLVYTCSRCTLFYYDYRHLLQHLFWRHGTESHACKKCRLRIWTFAAHLCNVLPVEDKEIDENYDSVSVSDDSQYYSERESEFCYCGKYIEVSSMIGCDGNNCIYQWYHFSCVGIVDPPVGKWFCPECLKTADKKKKKMNKVET